MEGQIEIDSWEKQKKRELPNYVEAIGVNRFEFSNWLHTFILLQLLECLQKNRNRELNCQRYFRDIFFPGICNILPRLDHIPFVIKIIISEKEKSSCCFWEFSFRKPNDLLST